MKRITCVFIAAIMLLTLSLSLASCGVKAENDLETIKSKGKIVVGMECAYAPYNWAQPDSNEFTVKNTSGLYADGYDVQIAKYVAEKLGVELVITAVKWEGLESALASGQIDMIIAGMSPTEDRKLSLDFTDTYYDSDLVIVVRKDGDFADATKIADFAGAKITAQQNTFHYSVIDQIDGVKKQTALDSFASLIQSLQSKAIDGYVCENPGAISAVASNSEFTYIEFESGMGFSYDPTSSSISIGLRKGSSLTSELNSILSTLTAQQKKDLMSAAIARQPSAD